MECQFEVSHEYSFGTVCTLAQNGRFLLYSFPYFGRWYCYNVNSWSTLKAVRCIAVIILVSFSSRLVFILKPLWEVFGRFGVRFFSSKSEAFLGCQQRPRLYKKIQPLKKNISHRQRCCAGSSMPFCEVYPTLFLELEGGGGASWSLLRNFGSILNVLGVLETIFWVVILGPFWNNLDGWGPSWCRFRTNFWRCGFHPLKTQIVPELPSKAKSQWKWPTLDSKQVPFGKKKTDKENSDN